MDASFVNLTLGAILIGSFMSTAYGFRLIRIPLRVEN